MDLSRIKAQARTSLHGAMAVPVLWSGDSGVSFLPATPDKSKLSARWHNKLVRNSEGSEYTDILEGVDRLVFNKPQLDALGITLTRGDLIRFPDYQNITFDLDQPEPGDGPLNIYWHVTRA